MREYGKAKSLLNKIGAFKRENALLLQFDRDTQEELKALYDAFYSYMRDAQRVSA